MKIIKSEKYKLAQTRPITDSLVGIIAKRVNNGENMNSVINEYNVVRPDDQEARYNLHKMILKKINESMSRDRNQDVNNPLIQDSLKKLQDTGRSPLI